MSQDYEVFEATSGATMGDSIEVRTVWIGNLRRDIGRNEVENFLFFLGFKDFVVHMGTCVLPQWAGYCFVECDNLDSANEMRHTLVDVSAHI